MLDADWIIAVATVLVVLVTAGSAYFIARQVQQMRLSAEATAFIEIAKLFDTPEMLAARTWMRELRIARRTYQQVLVEPDAWRHLQKVVSFGETAAILVLRQRISIDIVFDKVGPFIFHSYQVLRPLIDQRRIDEQFPEHAENFEILSSMYETWASQTAPKLERRAKAHVATRSYNRIEM